MSNTDFKVKQALNLNGSLAANIQTVTLDYTILDTDGVFTLLVDASLGAVAVDLPTAADNEGRLIVIKVVDIGTGVTVVPEVGQTLDAFTNAAPFSFGATWDSIMVQSNGTNWFII